MKEMVNAGPGTPQGALIAEYDFAAVDKNLSVEEAAGSLVGFPPVYLESLRQSAPLEEQIMMGLPQEMAENMIGGYLLSQTPEEKETMTAEFVKALATDMESEIKCTSFLAACVPSPEFATACFTDAEDEIKCASFLAACEPTPFKVGEIQDKMLEAALNAMRSVLDDHIDRARRLIHHVRRDIGMERSTLKPTAFTLDWLDMVVRRRRRWIGTAIATVDRLFSLSSCGGWTS